MSKVSVLIPARNEIYLQKTVEDLLAKAEGDIEVIAVLDGYWPTPPLPDNDRLLVIHRGVSQGMRAGINAAAAIASGEYLMKCDAHCMFGQGFDVKLAADCEKNWVVVPRRFALDPQKWELIDNPKYPIDYMYLSLDLHGVVWDQKNKDPELKKKPVDATMSNQGSVWFMPKNYFHELELMDEATYGTFWNEFQEIGLKAWLSGGVVMVNKNTWYAHWHKTSDIGRGYHLNRDEQDKALRAVAQWKDKGWHKQIHSIEWLVEEFWPVPTWPDDWKSRIETKTL